MSAVAGRLITRDPIGFRGNQTNIYAYCKSGPPTRVDLAGLSWSWIDFVTHYFIGFGQPIDLDAVGLADNYWGSSPVQDSQNALENGLLASLANDLGNLKCPGVAFSSGYSEKKLTDVTWEPGLFVKGQGWLEMKSNCFGVMVCIGCCTMTSVTCSIDMFIKDRFKDPLDGDRVIGIPFDFGIPYSLTTSNHGSYLNTVVTCNGQTTSIGSGFDFEFKPINPLYQ